MAPGLPLPAVLVQCERAADVDVEGAHHTHLGDLHSCVQHLQHLHRSDTALSISVQYLCCHASHQIF